MLHLETFWFTYGSEIRGLFFIMSLLGAFTWLETLLPLFKGRKGRLRHVTRHLVLKVVNEFITIFVLSATFVVFTGFVKHLGLGLFHWIRYPPWLETLLAIIILDLWGYTVHYADHRVPFLWRFHRMHHTDSQVDASTAIRFHPGEVVLDTLFHFPVITLFGITAHQITLHLLCLNFLIIFHHSNILLPNRLDLILRFFIVTPNVHRVHHSIQWRESNSNYGVIFTFWDRIFGTLRRVDNSKLFYGLPEFSEKKYQTLQGMLLNPLVNRPISQMSEKGFSP